MKFTRNIGIKGLQKMIDLASQQKKEKVGFSTNRNSFFVLFYKKCQKLVLFNQQFYGFYDIEKAILIYFFYSFSISFNYFIIIGQFKLDYLLFRYVFLIIDNCSVLSYSFVENSGRISPRSETDSMVLVLRIKHKSSAKKISSELIFFRNFVIKFVFNSS